jgi:hypothetical protein
MFGAAGCSRGSPGLLAGTPQPVPGSVWRRTVAELRRVALWCIIVAISNRGGGELVCVPVLLDDGSPHQPSAARALVKITLWIAISLPIAKSTPPEPR